MPHRVLCSEPGETKCGYVVLLELTLYPISKDAQGESKEKMGKEESRVEDGRSTWRPAERKLCRKMLGCV